MDSREGGTCDWGTEINRLQAIRVDREGEKMKMSENKVRGRSRKKKVTMASRIYAEMMKAKRLISAAVCISMIGSNVMNPVMLSYADSEDEVQEFELESEALREAVREAIADGSLISAEDLGFSGAEEDTYAELFDADGLLYEVKPEIEDTRDEDGNLDLRIFVRLDVVDLLDEGETLDSYEITGDEDVFFMLVNDTDTEQNAIVIVDGRETDVITVAPESAVDGAMDDGEASIEGGGAAGGAADASDQEAEEELVDDVSADADAPDDADAETENGEEPDADETLIDVTDSASDVDDEEKAADSDSDRMAEENTEAEDTQDSDDADENPDTTGDVDGDDDSDAAEADDSDSQLDEADKSENDSDPADDASDDSEDSDSDQDTDSGSDDSSDVSDRSDDSEKDSNDKSDDKDDDSDDSDKEDAGTRSASISVHSYNLVTLAASPADAEETEETEEVLSVSEDSNQLDGELYDAVAMEDGAAVVFVTTTSELGLEGVISSANDSVYTVETETAVITAVVPEGAFEEEVYLYAEEITESSETWQQVEEIWEGKAAQEGVSGADSTFVAYDICFKNVADEEVEPEAGSNISISIRFIDGSVLTGYDETIDNLSLLHISDDGEVEEVEAITTADDADGVEAIEYEVCSFSLMLMGIMAVANENVNVAQIGETSYGTVMAALEAVTDSTETTITMIADSTEDITISESQTIILDLNGYTLTGTGSGSVVTNSGTLTIQDSGGNDSGIVTGGVSTTGGGGVYSTGAFTLAGGTIKGNSATNNNGGGVYVTSAGSFIMMGGTVTENSAARANGSTLTRNGGGVAVQSASVTITGGSITNNTCDGAGGGLWATGTVSITGKSDSLVVISGNAAGTQGGGIYFTGDATMTYLEVSNNSATGKNGSNYQYYAGGISTQSSGKTVKLANVTVTENTSSYGVGGLGVSINGSFSAESCTITNNKSSSWVGGGYVQIASNVANTISYNFSDSMVTNNTGGTVGGLFVANLSTKSGNVIACLANTVIANNTGVTVGGVSGAINMTGGALYGNTSTDGNAANDWLVTKTTVTNTNISPVVFVPAASEMTADEISFDDYLWIDALNGLQLSDALNSETLGDESADTFYFTARELSYVAEITVDGTTTQYESIAEAIAAAVKMENQVTITLIAGESSGYTITEDVTIPENTSIVINLNGCTINKKSADYAITVSSGASLTLTGTGTVAGIDDQGSSLSISGNIEVGTVKLAKGAVITASEDFSPESLTIVLDESILEALNDASDTTAIVTLVQPAGDATLSETLISAITISGANVLVTVSKNDNGNIVAGITDLNGIFVDGVNGSDETGDGTYNNPVKTFAKAKELLEVALEDGVDCDGIYVINTITVTDTEEWSLDDLTDTAGKVSLMRLPTFTGILVTVGDGGNLTLSDITIDGQNYTVDSSLVQVYGDNAALMIEDGTVIQNNVNAISGAISEKEAAVTVVNGTLTMNGGTITGNTGNWGGGIALVANDDSKEAVMYFNGGTVSSNTADTGGGIFLYGNATLYMYGGMIDSNVAEERGGGLSVWSGATAYVYAGNITNNQQVEDSGSSETSYGGGAIYINDSSGSFGYGTLYLYNVEITENSHVSSVSTFNFYYDGTIAACNTSYVEINVTDGAVIHDNYAGGRLDVTLYSDTYQENFVLSPFMLSGGAYNWVDRAGNAVDVTDLSQYRGVANGLAFRSTATEITGLDRVTTYISGNSAIRTGAAIAANGNLIIGRDDGTVTLNIEKVWSDAFAKESIPDSIDVELYATDSKGVTADLGTLTLTAENVWTVTVTDLPKYDSYYDFDTETSGIYTYTVGEVPGDYFSVVTSNEVDDEDNDNQTARYDITISNLPNAELSLQKVVEGTTSAEDFKFEIELKYNDEAFDGYASASNASGAVDNLKFTDGKATMTLKADETLTLTLGAGMTYTVTETDSKGASKVMVNGSETDNTSGALTTDGASIVVTNVYTGDEPTPTPTPDSETGDLTVSKTVEGTGADTTKAFAFTVTLDDTGINGTYGNMTFADGVASFTLTHGQSKTATGLPAGISYEVTEEAVDGYTASSNGETGTIESDTISIAAFTNTCTSDGGEEPESGTGKLTVSKTVTGSGSKTKEFTFTVTLSDTSINGTYGDMTFVNGVATFTLKHGESVTAEGLPEGITYTVTEASTSGYRATSDGATGTIENGGVATVAFTNSKKSSGGGGGGGSSSSSPTTGTTAGSTSGPGVASGDSGTSDPGSPASPSDADPLTGLPKTGDNTSNTAMFTFLLGMVAVAYVILSDKKKEKANIN